MSEPIQCPACGASNPAGAAWCGLCYTQFGETSPDATVSAEDRAPERTPDDFTAPAAPPLPPSPEGEQLELLTVDAEADSDQATWTCRYCDTVVSVEVEVCPTCQQSIYDSFGGAAPAVTHDPTVVLRRSILPGGGHFVVGEGVLGTAILALTVISIVVGVFLLRTGVTVFGALLVFIGVTLWLLAAYDASRLALGRVDETVLRPRVISIVAGVWFVVIVAAAFQAQGVLPE